MKKIDNDFKYPIKHIMKEWCKYLLTYLRQLTIEYKFVAVIVTAELTFKNRASYI